MLTLKDIDLLRQHFLTKEEFNEAKKEFLTKDDFTDLKHDLNNDILNFKDEIITELRELRQEITVNSSFRQKIDKHDNRLDRLEDRVFN